MALKLISLSEAARRIGECDNTLRRAIQHAGIHGDAYLVEGSKSKKTPLFLEARLPQLKKLISERKIK